MVHELNILNKYFEAIIDGTKTFEVREKRDRNFKVGDVLWLHEIDEVAQDYTGRGTLRQISYVLDDEAYCKKGYVVLGLKNWRYKG